jgi:hypothetical protein
MERDKTATRSIFELELSLLFYTKEKREKKEKKIKKQSMLEKIIYPFSTEFRFDKNKKREKRYE